MLEGQDGGFDSVEAQDGADVAALVDVGVVIEGKTDRVEEGGRDICYNVAKLDQV